MNGTQLLFPFMELFPLNTDYAQLKKDERKMKRDILHSRVKMAMDQHRCLQLELLFEQEIAQAVEIILVEEEISILPRVTERAFGYYRDLLKHARKLTKNMEDAEDLVQNTFVRVQEQEHRYQEQGNLKGWLFRVMQNIFYSGCDKKKRMPVDYQEDINWAGSSGSLAEGEIVRSDIEKALNLLPEKARCICELRFLQGYKMEQICEELDLPIGTVKNVIHKSREKLLPLLGEYADTEGKIKQYDKFRNGRSSL